MTALQTIIFMLLTVIFVIACVPRTAVWLIQIWAFLGSFVIGIMFFLLALKFNFNLMTEYQFVSSTPILPEYGIVLNFGLDGLNLCFILLTTLIVSISTLSVEFTKSENYKQLILAILFLDLFIILAFLSTNALSFYIFFESILIPMFLIIGHWGSRERRIKAAFYFFLYTLLGSFFFYLDFYIYTHKLDL